MPYFLQYDNSTGLIKSVVFGAQAPIYAYQVESQVHVNPENKKVNLQTLAIEDYTPPAPTMEEIVYAKIEDAMAFGETLVIQYGVKNTLRGYTTEQVASVVTTLADVNALLRSGALATAKSVITALTATALVTEQDKSEFIAKIDAYLAQ